jgi:peptidoglycan/xylan/chitin deacetylase (PgdA/CDA1 family)
MSSTWDPARAAARAWRPTPLVAGSMGLHGLAALGFAVEPELWAWSLGAVFANHMVLGAVGLSPRSTWLGPNIRRLPEASIERREVALTFDDGPDPRVTPQVLEMLEARGMHATFFCIGRRVGAYPELAHEIVRRGHTIENHSSHHHLAFPAMGVGGFYADIAAAQADIERATGRAPRFFRAPAGFRNPLLDPVLHRLGLRLVSWTRRGFDTRLAPARVVRILTRRLAAGDILVLHDTQRGRKARVLETLPPVLEAIEGAGLRAVTLRDAFPD